MEYISELDDNYIGHECLGDASMRKRALAEPNYDFFGELDYTMRYPKAHIGSYVASEGFPVPLIRDGDAWQRAIDAETAMIRSEALDEYDGYRGIFTSVRVRNPEQRQNTQDTVQDQLSHLAIAGLRSGELMPVDYMKYYAPGYRTWPEQLASALQTGHWYNVKLDLAMPDASLWQYIPGGNVSIFGDPHVSGRYHIGYTPLGKPGSYQPTGGFWVEPDMHSTAHRFRKHDEDFVPEPVIEVYEAIAALPLFDTEQRPVMELQVAVDGTIHFLQYYKTGHRREYIDPFDIPFDPSADIKLRMVRGITPPDDQELKLFVTPRKMMPAMIGQAVYCDLVRPRSLETQFTCKFASFVLHEAYLSFQDNHLNSAPLFMPPVAAAFDWISPENDADVVRRVTTLLEKSAYLLFHDHENTMYYNLHITSNGREIVLSSDWEPHIVSYEDLRD